MQKLISGILILFLFTPIALAAEPVFQCEGDECGAVGGLSRLNPFIDETGIFSSNDIVAVILAWVSFVLALMGTIAFIAFIWAGFLYITAFAGGEENVETAKKTMIWTAIGIIIILTSYALVSAIINARVG